MTSKADLIFVPGAWHSPDSFDPTTTELKELGYTVHGINLPSVGAKPHLKSFTPDVEAVKSTLNKVLSSGKDVVMLYHSYGGAVGSEALADYVKRLQSGGAKEGWGKIRRLVYIAAFVLPEGGSLMAALGFKALPWFIIDVSFMFYLLTGGL
jgi:pimeloyl-ACP methyl ester carboxylesterase